MSVCNRIWKGIPCTNPAAAEGLCANCLKRQRAVERATAWNRANRTRRKEISLAYDARTREQKRAKSKEWRAANPTYVRDWKARHPGYDALHPASKESRINSELKRRARKQGAVATLTMAEWRDILAHQNGICFYCDKPWVVVHQEHMTPLSRGGTHTADNIVAACGPCNLRKGTMTAEEFYDLLLSEVT